MNPSKRNIPWPRHRQAQRLTLSLLLFCALSAFLTPKHSLAADSSSLPDDVVVGYLENWHDVKLSDVHPAYNVVMLAFAEPAQGSTYDMRYWIPEGYEGTFEERREQFLTDIQNLHNAGGNKRVLLSIGGADTEVFLHNDNERRTFVNSMLQIFSMLDYQIDGIDLDLESTSLNFGPWTLNNPAEGQRQMILAIQELMADYQHVTNKKLLLTMAPETPYVQGGYSRWQVLDWNGGTYLPIIHALRDELDLIHCQLYNAGGTTPGSGMLALDGATYQDDGGPDFLLAMTDMVLHGFDIVDGSGTVVEHFDPIPDEKVAVGLPASSCMDDTTGHIGTEDVCTAFQYLRGVIEKPEGANWKYTLRERYPELRGLMTWSIYWDSISCDGPWSFAENASCAFSGDTIAQGKSRVNIHPNPATETVSVRVSPFQNHPIQRYQVFDVHGRQVLRGKLDVRGTRLDVSRLPAGVYFMSVGSAVTKFSLIR